MKFGLPLPSEEVFNPYHWHDDVLHGCLTDNQLWGYMIHAGEELTENYWGELNNLVLENLMKIGIFKQQDRRDMCLNQTMPTIHHATTIASRILPCITTLEIKVRV